MMTFFTNRRSNVASRESDSPRERLRVHAAVAAMHGEPRIASPWTSQLLAGDVVSVFDASGDWVKVRSHDDYEGWMHRGYLVDASGDEDRWPVSLGSRVREPDGVERDLPLLARVHPTAVVISGMAVEPAELPVRFPATPAAIVQSASTRFVGASYMWGGVSPQGCDCSGFVQSIFRLHGIALPRDASQQVAGEPDDVPLEALRAADLAFFSDRDDRRITHVGIMLGEGRMAHSALSRGGFAIEQLVGPPAGGDAVVGRLRAQYVGARHFPG
jgi:gamma-D-glutamyl-L-lysine dipeptidyl-peptidase